MQLVLHTTHILSTLLSFYFFLNVLDIGNDISCGLATHNTFIQNMVICDIGKRTRFELIVLGVYAHYRVYLLCTLSSPFTGHKKSHAAMSSRICTLYYRMQHDPHGYK